MALCLALQLSQQPALARYLNDLVEHNAVGMGDFGKERKYIGSYSISVHTHLCVRFDYRGKIDLVNIDKRI